MTYRPFVFFCIIVDVFYLDRSADHQKLSVMQKQTFYFSITWEAFFVFFLHLVNIFCSDCLANHQKLNVIQK